MKHSLATVTGIALMVWTIFSSVSEYPLASLGKEDGFVDISLSISKHEKLPDGTRRFIVKNRLNEQKVSFILEISPQWKVKPTNDAGVTFYWGNARILSMGVESDAFINQVAKLYGIKGTGRQFKKEIPAQVVGLANDPKKMDSMPIKMKFFLNPDADESLYSEVFINIDLKNKILEFNEKDPDYRLPLVHSITQ